LNYIIEMNPAHRRVLSNKAVHTFKTLRTSFYVLLCCALYAGLPHKIQAEILL